MAPSDPRLRLRKDDLFAYLLYTPHPGQAAVHRSRARHRVLACGTRWGKSTCAAAEALAGLMAPCEQSLGWVVGPTYDLAQRVYSSVNRLVKLRLAHRVVEEDERQHRLVLRNLSGGLSEVRAKSADRTASLLGEALDWVVVDEAARLKREVWDAHLAPRLVDRRGWSLLLSTPRGCDWFYRAWRRGQRGRDDETESWQAPTWTNPHVPEEVVEAERARLPKETFDQEFAAKFLGESTEPCDTCGGPDPEVPGIVVLDEGEELGECPECDEPVDEDGRTVVKLWPNGKPHLTRIILHPGPANQQEERAAEVSTPGAKPVDPSRLGDPWSADVAGFTESR